MAFNDAENSKGLVTYNKNILLSIINLAAKEISGVASLCSNFSGSAFKRLFSNNYYEGVKLTHTKEGLVIDVYLNVFSKISGILTSLLSFSLFSSPTIFL